MNDYQPILEVISKTINVRIQGVLKDLCDNKYKLNYEQLCDRYCEIDNKKNNKKKIAKGIRCMAKKADGDQCTRRRRVKDSDGNIICPEVDYCGKHIKSIKYGRVDDDMTHKGEDYIRTIRENLDGEYYLVDPLTNTVYSYNKENPVLIGKKINDKLVLVDELIKMRGKDINLKISLKTTKPTVAV